MADIIIASKINSKNCPTIFARLIINMIAFWLWQQSERFSVVIISTKPCFRRAVCFFMKRIFRHVFYIVITVCLNICLSNTTMKKLSKRWIVSICGGWPESANPQMVKCHIKACNNDSYAARSLPDPVNNIMIIFIIFKVTPIIVI